MKIGDRVTFAKGFNTSSRALGTVKAINGEMVDVAVEGYSSEHISCVRIDKLAPARSDIEARDAFRGRK